MNHEDFIQINWVQPIGANDLYCHGFCRLQGVLPNGETESGLGLWANAMMDGAEQAEQIVNKTFESCKEAHSFNVMMTVAKMMSDTIEKGCLLIPKSQFLTKQDRKKLRAMAQQVDPGGYLIPATNIQVFNIKTHEWEPVQ